MQFELHKWTNTLLMLSKKKIDSSLQGRAEKWRAPPLGFWPGPRPSPGPLSSSSPPLTNFHIPQSFKFVCFFSFLHLIFSFSLFFSFSFVFSLFFFLFRSLPEPPPGARAPPLSRGCHPLCPPLPLRITRSKTIL